MLNEIIILTITHIAALIAGIVFDRTVLQRIKLTDSAKVRVDFNDMVRVTVLLSIFFTALASIIDAQFLEGSETSLVLTLGGAYAFGSLIGEGDFFKKIISAVITKK